MMSPDLARLPKLTHVLARYDTYIGMYWHVNGSIHTNQSTQQLVSNSAQFSHLRSVFRSKEKKSSVKADLSATNIREAVTRFQWKPVGLPLVDQSTELPEAASFEKAEASVAGSYNFSPIA